MVVNVTPNAHRMPRIECTLRKIHIGHSWTVAAIYHIGVPHMLLGAHITERIAERILAQPQLIVDGRFRSSRSIGTTRTPSTFDRTTGGRAVRMLCSFGSFVRLHAHSPCECICSAQCRCFDGKAERFETVCAACWGCRTKRRNVGQCDFRWKSKEGVKYRRENNENGKN